MLILQDIGLILSAIHLGDTMLSFAEYYKKAQEAYGPREIADLYSVDVFDTGLNVADIIDLIDPIAKVASKRLDKAKKIDSGLAAHTSDVLDLPGINELAERVVSVLEDRLFGCYLFVDKVYVYRCFNAAKRRSSWLWHWDNNPNEVYKVIIYLTDVDEDSAPFEYIKGPDEEAFIKPSSRLGPYHWKPAPNSSRVEQKEVDSIVASGGRTVKQCGPKGSMIVFNNNIIHRANIPVPGKTRDVLCLRVRPTVEPVEKYIDPRWTSTIRVTGAVPKDPAKKLQEEKR